MQCVHNPFIKSVTVKTVQTGVSWRTRLQGFSGSLGRNVRLKQILSFTKILKIQATGHVVSVELQPLCGGLLLT